MNTSTTDISVPCQPSAGVLAPRSDRRDVVTFLALVYATATVIALALPGTVAEPGPAPLLSLFVPALVVALLSAHRRRVRRHAAVPFGLRRPGFRQWPAAIVLPVLAIGVPYGIADLLGIVRIRDFVGCLANAPINLGLLTVLVLGEEIGWRGYMLPRLTMRMSARRASLVTGFAQGVFHLPLILLTSSYDSSGNRAFVATGAVTVITLGGIIFGWLRTRSASLWPVAIAHAAVNTCIIEAPYLTSRDLDTAASVVGEAGVLTLVCTGLIALWVYRQADWTDHPAS